MLSSAILCAYAAVSCVHAHRQTFHCVCAMQNFCGLGKGGLESKFLIQSVACTNYAECVSVCICICVCTNVLKLLRNCLRNVLYRRNISYDFIQQYKFCVYLKISGNV
jgi:hypothetical protein